MNDLIIGLGAVAVIAIILAVGFLGEPKPEAKPPAKKPRAPRKPKLAPPKDLKE